VGGCATQRSTEPTTVQPVNPYRMLYRLRITPWERDTVPTPLVELAAQYPSPGRALDIGCGTGRDAVYLAGRGWMVTGVDGVPRALDAAKRRARASGVDVKWVRGDVTRLNALGIGEGYALLVDRGCLHGLADREREQYADGVAAVAAPGARLLVFAFQPRSRGLGPRGITSEEVTDDLGRAWELLSSVPEAESRPPRWIGDAKPMWYQLQRRA
jgi:SAM-dependent methyltransferase